MDGVVVGWLEYDVRIGWWMCVVCLLMYLERGMFYV